jgi:hypothetical protein
MADVASEASSGLPVSDAAMAATTGSRSFVVAMYSLTRRRASATG